MRRLLDRVLDIGSGPDDAPELRRHKRLLVGFSLAVIPPDPVWSFSYYVFGETTAAIIPMLYIPLTIANLALFARTRDFDRARQGQCLIILLLPFLLHVALGGFHLSSGVVLWSVLAPFCALVFGGIAAGTRWLGAFAGAVALGALLETRATNGLPEWMVTGFFVANIATISGVAFGLLASYARQLAAERGRSERLLLNVLPAPIARRLREREEVIADAYDAATVIFADVVNSTPLTVELAQRQMVALLDEHVAKFDALADEHGVEKIRTIGDNGMGVAGVPRPLLDHAGAAARLALGMLAYVAERRRDGLRCLDFRIGINSGPVIGGVIGRRKFVFDIWGDAVNTADGVGPMRSRSIPGRPTNRADGRQGSKPQAARQDTFTVLPDGPARQQTAVRDAGAQEGRYPLVLFSHASGGHRRQSTFLSTHRTWTLRWKEARTARRFMASAAAAALRRRGVDAIPLQPA